jgi:hypothetical protein
MISFPPFKPNPVSSRISTETLLDIAQTAPAGDEATAAQTVGARPSPEADLPLRERIEALQYQKRQLPRPSKAKVDVQKEHDRLDHEITALWEAFSQAHNAAVYGSPAHVAGLQVAAAAPAPDVPRRRPVAGTASTEPAGPSAGRSTHTRRTRRVAAAASTPPPRAADDGSLPIIFEADEV